LSLPEGFEQYVLVLPYSVRMYRGVVAVLWHVVLIVVVHV
jgi:hypothetical protein